MAKHSLPKKTSLKKVLICILYHDFKIDLFSLISKINQNTNTTILVIVDGKKKINNQKQITKYNRKVKFIYALKKRTVAYNRNLGIKYAKKKFDLIIYLDSDVIPEKNISFYHLKLHKKNTDISVIGGPVIPSFFKTKFNIWEILDGCLSWFTSIGPEKEKIIKSPYHLPTCNLSIKTDFINKNKIMFDENLETGEDVDFCNKIREKNGKIMLIKFGKVFHQDRKNFKSFFNHHSKWGRHQFYTLYKKKYANLIGELLFNFIFLFFYPLLMPIINLISTFLTIYPWIKFNIKFIFLIIPTYIVHLIKGVFTYIEFFKSLKKQSAIFNLSKL